jgi:dienelactone hydrolase
MNRRWLLGMLVCTLSVTSYAEKREVSFNANGVAVKGSFYPGEKPGPGVLVAPECGSDRQRYENVASMLNTAGYSVLTFDLLNAGGKSKTGSANVGGRIDSALAFLKSQSGVNPRAIGVLAADCAVAAAVHVSMDHPEIRTMVLLSGGSDAEGEAYLKNSNRLPVLGVASDEDAEAGAALKRLIAASTCADSQIEMVKQSGHGAAMFAKQPDLEPDIVVWFRSNLSVAGYGLPPAIK